MIEKKIAVSESFYSIQGEGPTTGQRAVFLRLGGCNLSCGKPKNLETKATWVCDSMEVWKHSMPYSLAELFEDFDRQGFLTEFDRGTILVITGGEPLLQEKQFSDFLFLLDERNVLPRRIEVETNGTIRPFNDYAFFNVSPKLSNSGLPYEERVNLSAISFHTKNPTSIFKFVVTDESDIEEIRSTYIDPFNIHPEKVWLMPGADNQVTLREKSKFVVELAKQQGFHYSSRLQVEIWGKTTGV